MNGKNPGWPHWVLAVVAVLVLGACSAAEKPLTPAAATFKKDMRETIGKLAQVLVEPVCRADAAACEQAIISIYPKAFQDTLAFPFHVGVVNQEGILIYTIPPVKDLGDNYSQYQGVREALKERRIKNVRLYAPNGKELYLILAPLQKKGQMVGLLILRLDPAHVKQKWGISEAEFLRLELN